MFTNQGIEGASVSMASHEVPEVSEEDDSDTSSVNDMSEGGHESGVSCLDSLRKALQATLSANAQLETEAQECKAGIKALKRQICQTERFGRESRAAIARANATQMEDKEALAGVLQLALEKDSAPLQAPLQALTDKVKGDTRVVADKTTSHSSELACERARAMVVKHQLQQRIEELKVQLGKPYN
eukprot:m.5777 g.5777  ORF g.5777 m.5777 type:complete len:186 (-) comp7933_c0_seq1:438-995(-)